MGKDEKSGDSMTETLHQKKVRAGRLGGNACKDKYGREFFVCNGRRGGRPRTKSLEEILRQQALQLQNKNKEKEVDSHPIGVLVVNNPRALKRMFATWMSTREQIQEDEVVAATTVSSGEVI